jgi:ABC-2 type transport system ATP-binding protein
MTFKAHAGTKALPAAVRLLDDAQIAVEDVTALRPSLDDVFLSVVGRPAQPGDAHQGGKEVIKR